MGALTACCGCCSDDHIPRIFSFCAKSGKPWLILVPNYVYTKPYYQQSLQNSRPGIPTVWQRAHLWGGSGDALQPFYVAPPGRYYYWTPEGLRENNSSMQKTSPFMSFW